MVIPFCPADCMAPERASGEVSFAQPRYEKEFSVVLPAVGVAGRDEVVAELFAIEEVAESELDAVIAINVTGGVGEVLATALELEVAADVELDPVLADVVVRTVAVVLVVAADVKALLVLAAAVELDELGGIEEVLDRAAKVLEGEFVVATGEEVAEVEEFELPLIVVDMATTETRVEVELPAVRIEVIVVETGTTDVKTVVELAAAFVEVSVVDTPTTEANVVVMLDVPVVVNEVKATEVETPALVDVFATVDDAARAVAVCAWTTWYIFKRLPPPQYSLDLPRQTMSQPVLEGVAPVTFADPALMVFPQ